MRAMHVVKKHFENRGFSVEDVHRTQPYDFKCGSNIESVYVEVKGTRTRGEIVALTAGEVKFARAHTTNMVRSDNPQFHKQRGHA